tara:strand:- start:1209 stop:1592 length:384 start_codon:yes stop_codon:yes gene_type:complete
MAKGNEAKIAFIGTVVSVIGSIVVAWITSGIKFDTEISNPDLIYSQYKDFNYGVNETANHAVSCKENDIVTGGGFECRNANGCNDLHLHRSLASNESTWEMKAHNGASETLVVRISARCLASASLRK